MDIKSYFSVLLIIFPLLFCSCSYNNNNEAEITEGTLKEYYDYFEKINNEDLHLGQLAQEYYNSFGKNNEEEVKSSLLKFQEAQKKGTELILKKYPSGTIKFPFEQSGVEKIVDVKSAYISGYSYPWATADRHSFYITFEYTLKTTNYRYPTMRVEFYDTQNDIINACNVPLYKSGKSEIYVKPEIEFRKFLKLKICDPQN